MVPGCDYVYQWEKRGLFYIFLLTNYAVLSKLIFITSSVVHTLDASTLTNTDLSVSLTSALDSFTTKTISTLNESDVYSVLIVLKQNNTYIGKYVLTSNIDEIIRRRKEKDKEDLINKSGRRNMIRDEKEEARTSKQEERET